MIENGVNPEALAVSLLDYADRLKLIFKQTVIKELRKENMEAQSQLESGGR